MARSTSLVNSLLLGLSSIDWHIREAFVASDTLPGLSRAINTRKPSYRWQTRATRKHAKIVQIRRAYNVVADNTGLSSFV